MPINLELAKYKALVLVGGLGTRLQSVYSEGPKAMAPVRGTPFLAYLLRALARAGWHDVVLCVGYRSEQIQDCFGDGASLGLRLHYSIEQELLGTAGAIRLAADRCAPGERVFAMNGDTYHPLDYAAMLRFHQASQAACTIALAHVPDAGRYGSVELSPDGHVLAFREKSPQAGPGWVNSGTYVVEPSVIAGIPHGRPVSLEKEVLPHVPQDKLLGFSSPAYFIDIGVPEDYSRAQTEFDSLEDL